MIDLFDFTEKKMRQIKKEVKKKPAVKAINKRIGAFDTRLKINKVLKELDLKSKKSELVVRTVTVVPTVYGYEAVLHLPPGICKKDIEAKLSYFEEQCKGAIELKSKNNTLMLLIHTLELPNHVLYQRQLVENMKIPIFLGQSANGLVIVDLRDIPHIFFGGNTGKGKSSTFRVLADMIIANGALLCGIDLKRTEFGYLSKYGAIAKRDGEAHQLLTALEKEMDRRLDLLEKYDVDLIEAAPEEFSFITLLIDEITELTNKKSQEIVNRLSRLGRAPGISIVAATQRPSSKTYKDFSETKALFQGRLCFAVADSINSRMVLDNDLGTQIPDFPGRAIWQNCGNAQVIQVPWLHREEAKRLLKQQRVEVFNEKRIYQETRILPR